MFKDEARQEPKDQSNCQGYEPKENELEQNNEGCGCLERDTLQAKNSVEQDDRNDVIDDTLAENAGEKLGLLGVVDDADGSDNI
jgi:hypothetical protein